MPTLILFRMACEWLYLDCGTRTGTHAHWRAAHGGAHTHVHTDQLLPTVHNHARLCEFKQDQPLYFNDPNAERSDFGLHTHTPELSQVLKHHSRHTHARTLTSKDCMDTDSLPVSPATPHTLPHTQLCNVTVGE